LNKDEKEDEGEDEDEGCMSDCSEGYAYTPVK
jgi:hypothetical protein